MLKNLAIYMPQDLWSMYGHFSSLGLKELINLSSLLSPVEGMGRGL